MIKECRNCRNSTILETDRNWKVISWYCPVKKEVIPAYVHFINCTEFEPYESNLHDDNSARSDTQTRDKGIHQEE